MAAPMAADPAFPAREHPSPRPAKPEKCQTHQKCVEPRDSSCSYDALFALGGVGGSSPSAHTAPSAKYSFFQMGTVFFNVSIAYRQASNAAPRCGALTAMNTLVSPISRCPRRCTMATQ